MPTTRAQHWNHRYRSIEPSGLGWYQDEPAMSLRLLGELDPRPRSVIDVGAGASLLADHLIGAGVVDLTLLDVSAEALAQVRRRLAAANPVVSFVVADLLSWRPARQWDAWHDRAVFHFLLDPDDRARYVATAAEAVRPGGAAVIGTFAADGPEMCSGLPTVRYGAADLAAEFGAAFHLERSETEVHRTPSGGAQPFTWVVLRRHGVDPARRSSSLGR